MKEETTTTDGIIASVKHLIIEQPKRCFVNVYRSDGGKKFIGSEWSSYQEAIDESINGGPNNYIETVEIIRKP